MDQAGRGRRCLVADPSGVWCVQRQGGGGRQGGALATDDNAADARASPRDPGKIQTTPPRGADHERRQCRPGLITAKTRGPARRREAPSTPAPPPPGPVPGIAPCRRAL
ncbi:hypothetical protein SLITK23_20090 [Streptomyces lividans]|nr:hypothetical protein SLITK23_20090 [Streptomyces lividans]